MHLRQLPSLPMLKRCSLIKDIAALTGAISLRGCATDDVSPVCVELVRLDRPQQHRFGAVQPGPPDAHVQRRQHQVRWRCLGPRLLLARQPPRQRHAARPGGLLSGAPGEAGPASLGSPHGSGLWTAAGGLLACKLHRAMVCAHIALEVDFKCCACAAIHPDRLCSECSYLVTLHLQEALQQARALTSLSADGMLGGGGGGRMMDPMGAAGTAAGNLEPQSSYSYSGDASAGGGYSAADALAALGRMHSASALGGDGSMLRSPGHGGQVVQPNAGQSAFGSAAAQQLHSVGSAPPPPGLVCDSIDSPDWEAGGVYAYRRDGLRD